MNPILALLVLLWPQAASTPDVFVVDFAGGAQFQSLQHAVNAVPAGSVLLIRVGSDSPSRLSSTSRWSCSGRRGASASAT